MTSDSVTSSVAEAMKPSSLPYRLVRQVMTGRGRAWLWLIIGLGAVLRLATLGRQSLWFDEGFSYWIADRPWRELISYLPNYDTHPPLYYLMLQPMIALGGNIRTLADFVSSYERSSIEAWLALLLLLTGLPVGAYGLIREALVHHDIYTYAAAVTYVRAWSLGLFDA